MGSFVKIKHFTYYELNNAEYLTFLNSVYGLLPSDPMPGTEPEEDEPIVQADNGDVFNSGAPTLGLSASFVQQFFGDLTLLADVVDTSRISQETEQAAVHEKNRDSLVTYVTNRITSAGSLPLTAEREAGKFLYKVIKPYIGIARLPNAQETAKIQGLLIDLRKPENAPHVTTLGLDIYLTELENENNAYIALTSQRARNRAANKTETSEAIRTRLNGQYDDLVLLAQSFSIAIPTEASATFVSNMNQLISETVTAYHQRKKGNGGSSNNDDVTPDVPSEPSEDEPVVE